GCRDGLRRGKCGVPVSVCWKERMEQANDNRLGSAVLKEVSYGKAHTAIQGQAAERALVIAEVIYCRRRVDRTARSGSHKCGDGSRNSDNRPDSAGNFFDVDSRVGGRNWHSISFLEIELPGFSITGRALGVPLGDQRRPSRRE